MELRIIGVCLSRPDEPESEVKRRIEAHKAKIDAEWREHIAKLRELLQLKELPDKEEFEKLPLDRQAQLIAAEQGFLEIAKVTFVIRKGPASFGGLG